MNALARFSPFALASALVWLSPSAAHGQDVATADALFREGTAKRKANQLDEACALFRESYRLDPAGGTTFALADCLEAQGKLAQAAARFREAAVIARQRRNADKEKLVAARLDAIEPRIPTLAVKVLPAWRKLPGLVVTRDDQEMGPPSFDLAVPVDPGPHVVRVSAEGIIPFSKTVTVGEGQRAIVEPSPPEMLPSGAPDRGSPPAASATATASAQPGAAPGPSAAPPPPAASTRTRFIAAGALGVVGLASAAVSIGSFIGSRSRVDEAAPFCPDACDARGHTLYEEARTRHFMGIGFGAASVALLASAGVLAFTEVGKGSTSVTLSPGQLSLGFTGRF